MSVDNVSADRECLVERSTWDSLEPSHRVGIAPSRFIHMAARSHVLFVLAFRFAGDQVRHTLASFAYMLP